MANILILEDTESYAKLLSFIARKLGHNVVSFTKPSDAIKQNMIKHADLIISDFEMDDGETALDLLEYLKNNTILKPVIINSGMANVNKIIEDTGYDNFVNFYADKLGNVQYFKELITNALT